MGLQHSWTMGAHNTPLNYGGTQRKFRRKTSGKYAGLDEFTESSDGRSKSFHG